MQVREGRLLCPELIVRTPDPEKYRDVHLRFCRLFREYSPAVTPKSIDEAVLDFSGTVHLEYDLLDVGREIKQRVRQEIGEWISCNIGISTNRFLAKLAASLHKPDGLDEITHENLEGIYAEKELLDLCGINTRYQARLNVHGIYTPLQLLQAPLHVLKDQVFRSINGYYWFLRVRGYEVDQVVFDRKSFGQQYALKRPTNDPEELSRILMKLCEKLGRRLRRAGHAAQGIHVACAYQDYSHWHQGKRVGGELYATLELYRKAQLLLNGRTGKEQVITHLGVSCYGLVPSNRAQPDLFEAGESRERRIALATDEINDRYGEFIITPAIMLGMEHMVLDRVSYGNIRDLEDLHATTPSPTP
jgi:DNA polymerase-4